MKTILLYLCVFICLLSLLNCSNDNETINDLDGVTNELKIDENEIFSKVSKLKVSKVLDINDDDEKRVAYRLLNKEEKMFLWYNKLDYLIKENKLYGIDIKLNKQQKALLIEAKSKLSLEFFDENQNDKKEFVKNIFIPDFIKRATKVFPDILFGSIFYEISVPKSKLIKNEKTGLLTIEKSHTILSKDANPNPICDCGTDHFFSCSWGQYDDYCSERITCKYQDGGCGFFGGYECNGICKHF